MYGGGEHGDALGTDAVPLLAGNPPTHFQIMVAGGGAEMLCGLTCLMDISYDWQASWALPQWNVSTGGAQKLAPLLSPG